MTNDTRPQVVRGYLRELDAELAGLPDATRRDIVDGVAGDLDGLDPAAAAARIEQLGDPAAIAAEARAGFEGEASGSRIAVDAAERMPPAVAVAEASDGVALDRRDPVVSRGWYVVVTSVAVAVGGFVIPILGWVVGIALMWLSTAWSRVEKWVATLLPVGLIVVVAVIQGIGALIEQGRRAALGAEPAGPDLPFAFVGWHTIVLLPFVYVVVGIWLLVRGLRRR
ncbi:hypothetical protein [Agromyces sp. LHK192]|uniref:HAAS signaling domain-containing protein n=1 Tax=Agromyces sp. LHK192 TaxID=2498704 RepID=UPI000FD96471|nr:hypothetical protein [Agromyces sp. LHK192]